MSQNLIIEGVNRKSIQRQGLLSRLFSIPEFGVIIPLFVLIAITGILAPRFFMSNNIVSILKWLAFYSIVAIGETIVLLVAEVDISVGQVAGVAAIVFGWFMTKGDLNPVLALVIALVVCAVLGSINGILVAYFKLSAFIATIGMLYIAKGLKFIISKGYPIYPLPDSVNKFGSAEPFGLSWALIIAVIMVIVFDQIMRRTVYGRKLYAVGDNREVAALSGINVKKIKVSAFIICAVLAGIAGCLLVPQLHSVDSAIGEGWELATVASVAVGGVSLAGGFGTVLGAAIGVVFIAVLNNSIVLLKIDANLQTVLIGIVMLIAVGADVMKRNRKVKG
jgi:ribose transport system permease protein